MEFRELRLALKKARLQVDVVQENGTHTVGMTLDQAAAASGFNRSTIHALESVDREPDLKPELETIERLVLAYKLTLSAFFAQIEGLQPPAPSAEDQVHGEITHAAAHDDATEGSLAYIAAKTLGDAIRALQQRCDKLEAEAAAAHRRQAAGSDDETREHSGLRRRAARRAARRNPKSRRRPPKR